MSADAPPSYDSIVDKLTKSLGPQPKLEDVYKIREQLPKYEKDVLAAHIYEVPPMTKEEEFKLTLGIAQSMSSEIGHDYLDTEAREVNKAVKEIQAMFNKLNGQLSEVDRQYTSPKDGAFAPRLAKHSNEYNRILQKSRDLATEIAVYGQQFDGVIIPVVTSEKYTNEEKKTQIRSYIDKDKKFKEASDQTIKDFAQLKLDFGSFTGQFSSWAKEKKESQNAQLEAIKKELVQMVETLAKRRTELLAIGLATAAVLPVTGIIASFAGPFAPFVIIGGLVLAGVGVAALVALVVIIHNLENDIADKEKDRKELEKSIANLTKTQGELTRLGSSNLKSFQENLNVLEGTWVMARSDAVAILTWLEGGAEYVKMPEQLKFHSDNAVSIYKSMAKYLSSYAKGTV